MSYSILDILSMGEVANTGQSVQMHEVTTNLGKFQDELGLDENGEMVNVYDLPKEHQERAIELLKQHRDVETQMSAWSLEYKRSVARLNRTYGLPVHINATDIHDYNIDIDTIVQNLTSKEGDLVAINEFFHDSSIPAFATAPYNYCFIELESQETYEKSIAKYYQHKYGENASKLYGTYMLVQSWVVDDYVEYLHTFQGDGTVGTAPKDTLYAHFGVQDFGEDKELIDKLTAMDMTVDDLKFFQLIDIITVGDIKGRPRASVDNQLICWYDKFGQPNITRQINPFDLSDRETRAEQIYYATSLEKVFQWWNSDNDLLEPVELQQKPSWAKAIRKHNKKNKQSKQKQQKIRYKTLKVRKNLVVVDDDGTERQPLLREIAQHTRRGHFAKYGFDGNGKLFGKYDKIVYRKPKTIGKLANGLVIKDYDLITNKTKKEKSNG